MEESLRNILEAETKKAECEIRKILQQYHDRTGMVPASINFSSLDVRTWEDYANQCTKILVNEVYLKANTCGVF